MRSTRATLSVLLALAMATVGMAASASETAAQDDVTLKVWSWLPNDHEEGMATYEAIFAAFEEANPGVTIELTAPPYPTFWDSWVNATIAGQGPDVISMYGGITAAGYADSLEPLQDRLGDALDGLRFIPESYSPDGNLYAVPAGAYAYHLLANEVELAKVGLTAADAFGTWDSLLAACGTLADAGLTPFASGWADGYELEGYMYVLMTQLLDADGFAQWVAGELPLTDERFVTGMNHVVEMRDAGCFSEDSLGKATYYDAFDDIIAGDAAAFRSGDGSTALDAEANNGEGSMVVMPFPQVPESAYEQISDAGPNQGWSVTSWASNKDMAAALVAHIISAESQQLLWDNTALVPNRNDVEVVADTDLFQDYLDIIAQPENHTTFMAYTDPALAIFQREASNLIAGRTDTEAILAEADAAQQRALEAIR